MSSTLVQEWAVILTLPKEDSRPKRCLNISSESIQGREKARTVERGREWDHPGEKDSALQRSWCDVDIKCCMDTAPHQPLCLTQPYLYTISPGDTYSHGANPISKHLG